MTATPLTDFLKTEKTTDALTLQHIAGGVEMLTKLGCSSLYAEMTILDSSGRNIGFTNDSANGVRPNEKVILIFISLKTGQTKVVLN